MAGWCPANIHLDEAQRLLDQRLPDGDYETMAGLLMHNLGRLPEVGDTIEITLPLDSTQTSPWNRLRREKCCRSRSDLSTDECRPRCSCRFRTVEADGE